MENMITTTLNLLTELKNKGYIATLQFTGNSIEFTHHESDSYKIIANIRVTDSSKLSLIYDYMHSLL